MLVDDKKRHRKTERKKNVEIEVNHRIHVTFSHKRKKVVFLGLMYSNERKATRKRVRLAFLIFEFSVFTFRLLSFFAWLLLLAGGRLRTEAWVFV